MVRAIMIVEMAGRPARHLTESLEKHISILNEVKDITVHSIRVSKPREIKREDMSEGGMSKEDIMFTAFAEADFECDNFGRLSETMFDFMPSSVEVIEPSKIGINTTEATSLLNNISGRLHRYDEIAKIAGARISDMNRQLEIAQEIINERDAKIVQLTKKEIKKKNKKAKKN